MAFVQSLLQDIQPEVVLHAASDPPAHDAPGVHAHVEHHVQLALPDGNVGEVRHSQFVEAACLEMPVDMVYRALSLFI